MAPVSVTGKQVTLVNKITKFSRQGNRTSLQMGSNSSWSCLQSKSSNDLANLSNQ